MTREGLIRESNRDNRSQSRLSAAIRRLERPDGDRELGKRRCAMQDGPRGDQVNDRPRQFALQLIDVDGGIEQDRCRGGDSKWIKRIERKVTKLAAIVGVCGLVAMELEIFLRWACNYNAEAGKATTPMRPILLDLPHHCRAAAFLTA